MSLKTPERTEGAVQLSGVDEDAEENKLGVQNHLVDHRRQDIEEEVDEVLWRILR